MIRIPASSSYVFRWSPSDPSAYAAAASVSLTILWAAGTAVHVLTQRVADTILTIDSSRRRIGLTWGADGTLAADVAGRPMAVWFDGGASHQSPGRVARLVSDSGGLTGVVELAEPLPMAVAVGALVRWQSWAVTLSSVPALLQQPVLYRVDYSAVVDGVDGGLAVDEGVLAVVRAPFATGLSHAALLSRSPWMANGIPAGQQGWGPQIAAAESRLIRRVQKRLTSGQTVERLTGPQFVDAHAAETRRLVLIAQLEAGRDTRAAIDQAEADIVATLDDIFAGGLEWYDADGDGVATASEGGTRPGVMVPRSHVGNASLFDVSASDALSPVAYDRIRVTGASER